jgi:hypothetical protein
MSVQRRLTVPVGRDLSTCMVQAYGGWFTGSSAPRTGVVGDRPDPGPTPATFCAVEAVKREGAGQSRPRQFPAPFPHGDVRASVDRACHPDALLFQRANTRPHLQVFHGAGRTRTGDLLGAISALSWPEFGLASGFPAYESVPPTSSPTLCSPFSSRTTPAVADEDAVGRLHTLFSKRRPNLQPSWRRPPPLSRSESNRAKIAQRRGEEA